MQLVYLDEAGISNRVHEPYLVVGGVIVNADKKWKLLEQHLSTLAEELVPEYVPYYGHRLIFHAKDIWHGSGLFDRKKWPLERRLEILTRLSAIPAEFNLPLVVSYINRNHYAALFDEQRCKDPADQKIQNMWAHLEAFINAVRRVEKWMEANASDEVAILIAEDTDRIKRLLASLHSSYTDRMSAGKEQGMDEVQALIQPLARDKNSAFNDYWGKAQLFQSNYIVDAVHFAKKEASLLLQIADHCAFFAKRKLMKCPHISPLYEKITPQITFRTTRERDVVVRMPSNHLSLVPLKRASQQAQPG
ncbi:DUF3800 domain-containing protein [Rhodopseudomonas sp. HC1]|uniref:DUF3800 domain-containing protein n=1 Tax=Rhodopseudomonas infernalis TaxID=2897386 RepID=UPI001EE7DE00|nr:DUF3800 domain-containing protein [Rhodopseudomonas infernalis]MCG6205116.1 DUF3800 domain-containing protein [Rhodopseudomonas infernalis]